MATSHEAAGPGSRGSWKEALEPSEHTTPKPSGKEGAEPSEHTTPKPPGKEGAVLRVEHLPTHANPQVPSLAPHKTRRGEGSTPITSAFSRGGGRGIKFKVICSHTKNVRPAWATQDVVPPNRTKVYLPKRDGLRKAGLAFCELYSLPGGGTSLSPSIQNTGLRGTF